MSTAVNGNPASGVVRAIASGSEAFHRTLRRYLAIVATALGVGLESCMVDIDTPVSAYLAVDQKLAALPDRDVALLWDEEHGWSIAAETHCGEDLIVLAYLDTDTVVPPADLVVRFVEELCAGNTELGRLDPPAIRTAGEPRGFFRQADLTGTADATLASVA
ncbi:MAG TPA: DUF6292 family protein [Pseudonocardiaceae bacterium]|jgi:hypothetical protein|nr:DUF6292 family protein [Pseudonocardiaceae bacterium]